MKAGRQKRRLVWLGWASLLFYPTSYLLLFMISAEKAVGHFQLVEDETVELIVLLSTGSGRCKECASRDYPCNDVIGAWAGAVKNAIGKATDSFFGSETVEGIYDPNRLLELEPAWISGLVGYVRSADEIFFPAREVRYLRHDACERYWRGHTHPRLYAGHVDLGDHIQPLRAGIASMRAGYERYQLERIWLWAVTTILMAIVIRGYYLTIRYLPASIRHARAVRDRASGAKSAEPSVPRKPEDE